MQTEKVAVWDAQTGMSPFLQHLLSCPRSSCSHAGPHCGLSATLTATEMYLLGSEILQHLCPELSVDLLALPVAPPVSNQALHAHAHTQTW